MTRPALLSLLALASCGTPWAGVLTDDAAPVTIKVQRLETTDPDLLGWTERTGNNEWTAEVREDLADDPARLANVVLHELLQPLAMIGGLPDAADSSWYAVSGDTQPAGGEVSQVEADWINATLDSFPDIRYFYVEPQDWNALAVADAIARINEATGWRAYR